MTDCSPMVEIFNPRQSTHIEGLSYDDFMFSAYTVLALKAWLLFRTLTLPRGKEEEW
jgi:hypothetical protein